MDGKQTELGNKVGITWNNTEQMGTNGNKGESVGQIEQRGNHMEK